MKLKITVHGVAYEVDVEVLDAEHDFLPAGPLPPAPQFAGAAPMAAPPVRRAPAGPTPGGPSPGAVSAENVLSPIAGTVMQIKCKVGDTVKNGQVLLVIEAMKMETSIASHRDGTIKRIAVAAGDGVRENELLVEFE